MTERSFPLSKIKTTARTQVRGQSEASFKRVIIAALILGIFILIFSLIQTTSLRVFGKVPAITFALVCAIAFLFGEKAGALSGIFGGVLLDCLGSADIALTPLFFMLCGYVCGVLTKYFLSRNFPSYLVYCLIFGILREMLTVFYFGLISTQLNIMKILTEVVIFEFFAFMVLTPVAYILPLAVKKIMKL